MINQYSVRDTRGNIAFYICEIMPGVLRIADGKDQPLFIKRDVLVDAILKTDTKKSKKEGEKRCSLNG